MSCLRSYPLLSISTVGRSDVLVGQLSRTPRWLTGLAPVTALRSVARASTLVVGAGRPHYHDTPGGAVNTRALRRVERSNRRQSSTQRLGWVTARPVRGFGVEGSETMWGMTLRWRERGPNSVGRAGKVRVSSPVCGTLSRPAEPRQERSLRSSALAGLWPRPACPPPRALLGGG